MNCIRWYFVKTVLARSAYHLSISLTEAKDSYIIKRQIAFWQLRLAWSGSCAIRICEPRQVRKEAAINGISYVPQIGLFHLHAGLAKGNLYELYLTVSSIYLLSYT